MARIIMLLVLIAILIFNVRSLSREENEKYLQLKKEFKTLTKEEYLKLRRRVKRLNKPAVKTFQTEYGDIFDCVDIYKQPAFDHPLMKNQTVKLRPSFHTKEMDNQHRNEFNKSDCPPLTVPIRRTEIHDLLVTKSVTKSLSDYRNNQFGHERHLSVYVKEKAKSAPSDQAPVIDITLFGYVRLLGKGMQPEGRPVVVKAKLVSKTAEKKIKEAGRAVMLTA